MSGAEVTRPTPGPWRQCRTQEFLFGQARDDGGFNPIGFVYAPSFAERSEVGRRALADVALIAAAPDLLTAAAQAAEVMEKAKKLLRAAGFVMEEGTISKPYGEALDALRAAIAKAGGAS